MASPRNGGNDHADKDPESKDDVNPLPSHQSSPQIGGSASSIKTARSLSIQEKTENARTRRISKLIELESSTEGGLIDRRLVRSSINMDDLKLARELGIDQETLLDVLKHGKKSAKFAKVSALVNKHKGVQVPETTTDTLRTVKMCVRLHLTWRDVKYTIKTDHGPKTILDNVSGEAHPGEMLAIMGPSGAGKTTLLNILAGRVASGTISGTILVNGKKRDTRSWKYMIGYVESEDIMYGTLTVEETLYYTSMLRLPRYLDHEQKRARAIQVMVELGLSKVANTRIGDEFTRGVSGGEKKRVSIGIELVANPGILFLDEPTSGLDSYVAYNIMESISVLALRELRTVIATIHQPIEDILFLFDRVLLITRGSCAYFGLTSDALSWFDDFGYECPIFTNPAEFFLRMISIDTRNPELEKSSSERVDFMIQEWKNHVDASREPVDISIENGNSSNNTEQTPEEVKDDDESIHMLNPALAILKPELQAKQIRRLKASSNHQETRNTWMNEFYFLLRRSFLGQIRNRPLIYAMIFEILFIILIVGFTFFQLPDTQAGVQARIGVLFFYAGVTMSILLQGVAVSFPLERIVITRERYAGSYRMSSYYVSKALSILPIRTITLLVYVCASYYIVGLNPSADRFFIFIGIMIEVVFCSCALGLLVGALGKTVEHTQIIGAVIILILYIYTGNLIPVSVIPPELSWIQYLSFLKYSYSAAMQNEFDGAVFLCQNGQPPVDNLCGSGFATGEQVLQQYDLLQFSISTNCLILIGLGFGYHLLAYLAVRFMFRPKLRL